jgi:signal transduction histidine kinase
MTDRSTVPGRAQPAGAGPDDACPDRPGRANWSDEQAGPAERPVWLERWSSRGEWLWYVLPLVTGLIQVFGSVGADRHAQGSARPSDALAWLLLLAGPLAIFVARRYPVPVLALTSLLVALYISHGYANGPIYLSYVFALVVAVLRGYHLYAWCSVPALFLAEYAVPSLFAGAPWPPLVTFGSDVAWALACLALAEGLNFRNQRVQALMRARREQSKRRSSDERLAIARELHDVLAHSISLINVQAGTALEVMDRRPEQARIALEAIKQTSKQTLGEMRSVLDALRGPGAPARAPLLPTTGLAQLDGLLARARATGLEVRVLRTGAVRDLPAGVDLAAFRIVQEALTNVVRHAGAGSAAVLLGYGVDAVRLRVEDDGHGYSAGLMNATGMDADGRGGAGEGGNGLPGMRERALALGGEFGAGNRPGGGFAVEAVLPVGGAAPGGGFGTTGSAGGTTGPAAS